MATEVRSLNSDWQVRSESFPATAMRRTARSITLDVPEFLLEGPLEPYRIVVAEPTASRALRAGAPRPVEIAVDVEPQAAVVAVARHASGAITFHLPTGRSLQAGVSSRSARGRRRGPSTEVVSFRVDSASPEGFSGLQPATARRGIAGRVIRIVVMKVVNAVVDAVAGAAIAALGAAWEKRTWSQAKRATGWKQVDEAGMLSGELILSPPAVPAAGRGLLLLHGTFSHTVNAFQSLAKSGMLRELLGRYRGHIYGFDHFSVSLTPAENARALAAAVKRKMIFDVITHSRGGLVVRSLAANPTWSKNIQLGKVILTQSPNRGTPLATPARWEDTLGWFANLLEMLPDNTFTTAGQLITESLSWLAQRIPGSLPGIASMDANGDTIRDLVTDVLPAGDWYALAANYEPPNTDWAWRLADMGIDSFFATANDLVVPTEGGWQLGKTGSSHIPAARVGCFGPGGNLVASQGPVHHCNIFTDSAAQNFISRALAGEELGLPAVQPLQVSRSARQSVVEEPAPFSMPRSAASPPLPVSSTSAGGDGGGVGNRGATAGVESPPPPPPREMEGDDLTRVRPEGWSEELPLHLIVMPPVGNDTKAAQLLATYGSARVLAPFRLSKDEDTNIRTPWGKIIGFHKDVESFAEGRLDDLSRERIYEGGSELFNVLFQGDVRRLYDQARYLHTNHKLNVIFTSMIPWVADLPWEFAFDPGCKAFLATSDVRFVRNVLTPVPADKIPDKTQRLDILVVAAQPMGLVSLSEAEEVALIKRSFKPLLDAQTVNIDVITRATPEKLHVRVCEKSYDIIHFIGHGEFDNDMGYLIFEDDQKQSYRLSTDVVKDILRGRGIRLIFLNACESAKGGRADYNKGVAPGLVADGVPAVVANQYPVLDQAATVFSLHFYGRLTQGMSLGDAMRESRIAMEYSGGDRISWAVPVLFARNPDATLCKRIGEFPQSLVGIPGLGSHDVVPRRTTTTSRSLKAAAPASREHYRIAVSDLTDSFSELEETLRILNEVQDVFEFVVVNLSVPYGTWQSDSSKFEGVAYLTAERVAKRLRSTLSSIGADYLFCITDRPMAGSGTAALYVWSDPESDYRLNLFSTWGFEPPLRNLSFQRALANGVAATVAEVNSGETFNDKVMGSAFYFNPRRELKYVSGWLSIPPDERATLKKRIGTRELQAIEALLGAFQGGEEQLSLVYPRARKPRVSKKKK